MKDKKDKIYYFQEKSNDILDLQDELNAEEIGIYFILKAGYFKYSGELKKENANQRCKFFGDINKFNSMIAKLFDEVDGLLVNNSWLSEIKGIKALSDKRKVIAESRWKTEQEKKEAKRKQKGSKKEANVNEECKLELPSFINKNLFDGFVEMRNKIKKPLTDKAKELLIKKLTEFENKQAGFANIALENSIESSWQGVFEPRPNNQQQQPKQTFLTKQQIEQNQNMQIFSNLQKKYGGENA